MRLFPVKSFIVILFVLPFVLQCQSSSEPGGNRVEADFPVGLTTVYATALYTQSDSALTLNGYTITSLRFENITSANDSSHFSGPMEQYMWGPNGVQTIGGDVNISVTDKWVLLQNHPMNTSVEVFLKQDSVILDTTAFPTAAYNQFPMYPRVLEENQQYVVTRPAADSTFLQVRREFSVKSKMEWRDTYGVDEGLYIIAQHFLGGFGGEPIDFQMIIDEHGIVNSQRSLSVTVGDPGGTVTDTLTIYTINRRLKDFSAPATILPLEKYGEQVEKDGLLFF